MRIVTAAAALALSLAVWLVPPAAATFGPPLLAAPSTLHSLPIIRVVKTGGDRSPSSCSVHARRTNGTAGRIARKLAPVACEQPPRSKQLGTGFFIVLAP